MYLVRVHKNEDVVFKSKPLDSFAAPFGQFVQIGYWLDSCGYNEPQYKVVIEFRTKG